MVAVQVPLYLLGRDLLDSRPAGAVATATIALNPQVLEWHVSAGGVVRAFAFLYAVTAIYAGYHVFASRSRVAVVGGLFAFGLTLLSHPTYSTFVVASYVLFWLVLDRSPRGLARGAAVGLGGAVLAAPWLGWVVTTHGPGILTAAAGTHGGIGGGVDALYGHLSPYMLVPLAAAGYLLVARRWLVLPVWLVAVELLFQQPRFSYTVSGFVVTAAAVEFGGRLGGVPEFGVSRVDPSVVAATLLVLVGTVAGGAYLGHEMTLTHDPSTPEFLDAEAVEAMEWAATDTRDDATFVVLGDAAEWFPALTERTILVGPWGVEWQGSGPYYDQLDAFVNASECRTADCVISEATAVGQTPDYVYVPRGSIPSGATTGPSSVSSNGRSRTRRDGSARTRTTASSSIGQSRSDAGRHRLR
ncbi:hypothetical protein VB779_03385 [Haloarculaceae archaeon H-GB11]|nr:hypothetical protein [Haloarculaceae archaeon H-GB11]